MLMMTQDEEECKEKSILITVFLGIVELGILNRNILGVFICTIKFESNQCYQNCYVVPSVLDIHWILGHKSALSVRRL